MFLFRVVLEYRDPDLYKEWQDAEFEYLMSDSEHFQEGKQRLARIRWRRENPDPSRRRVAVIVNCDNPFGDGAIRQAIRQIMGEIADEQLFDDYKLVVRGVEYLDDVEFVDRG